MTAETSLLAYEHVKPKLPDKYAAIVEQMRAEKRYGMATDWTGQELAVTIPGAWKRLSEMERLGLIKKTKKRICDVTGEYAWGYALV